MSPSDGYDLCLQCLGHDHTETSFMDGSCSHCENMNMSMLRSWLSFFFKRQRSTSTASRLGPSTSGYEVSAKCVEDEQGDAMGKFPPGESP